MSNYNFEGQSDDWDERGGDLSWKEYDWQQYLKRHEQEIEKFIDCYTRLKEEPDHIDEVAHQMGWDAEDWSVGDASFEDDVAGDLDRMREDEVDSDDDFDPYTLLRHPVFVVVRGLYRNLSRMWEQFQHRHVAVLPPTAGWKLAKVLHEGETSSILAVQALDMGDYALAVCQIKLALSAINQTFELMPRLVSEELADSEPLFREMRIRLFDLREICLRVMNDCREEIRRHGRDHD